MEYVLTLKSVIPRTLSNLFKIRRCKLIGNFTVFLILLFVFISIDRLVYSEAVPLITLFLIAANRNHGKRNIHFFNCFIIDLTCALLGLLPRQVGLHSLWLCFLSVILNHVLGIFFQLSWKYALWIRCKLNFTSSI